MHILKHVCVKLINNHWNSIQCTQWKNNTSFETTHSYSESEDLYAIIGKISNVNISMLVQCYSYTVLDYFPES